MAAGEFGIFFSGGFCGYQLALDASQVISVGFPSMQGRHAEIWAKEELVELSPESNSSEHSCKSTAWWEVRERLCFNQSSASGLLRDPRVPAPINWVCFFCRITFRHSLEGSLTMDQHG